MRKKRLARASFRGVKFYIDEFSVETARRIERVEYPGTDKFSTSDLGGQIKSYLINGFVIGPDFENDRQKLLKALYDEGPGTLDIPYFDKFPAHCISVRTNETTMAGGIVMFSMTFCASSKPAVETKIDPNAITIGFLDDIVKKAGEGLDQAAEFYKNHGGSVLDTGLNYVSAFGDRLGDLSDLTLKQADNVEKSFTPLIKVGIGVNQFSAAIIEYKRTVLGLGHDTPFMLFDAFKNFACAVVDPFTIYSLVTLGLSLDALPSPVPLLPSYLSPETLAARDRVANTWDISVQSIVIASAATMAIKKTSYESQAELNATRSTLIKKIDELKARTENTPLFRGLDDIKTVVFHELRPSKKAILTRNYTVYGNGMPAVVIAYDSTGDLSRLDDIIKINNIAYPPSIRPSQHIEVPTS